jgi:hypothetical protein
MYGSSPDAEAGLDAPQPMGWSSDGTRARRSSCSRLRPREHPEATLYAGSLERGASLQLTALGAHRYPF